MKSKSFDLKQVPNDKVRHKKTFDFVGLYKSAAETGNKNVEKRKTSETFNNDSSKAKYETPISERSLSKGKKRNKQDPVDVSLITVDGSSLKPSSGASTPLHDTKTSTPYASAKTRGNPGKVKSIMKNGSVASDHSMDGSKSDVSVSKPKKRNKSVSFMLEDNEEVVVKKTKSNESIEVNKSDGFIANAKIKDKRKNNNKFKKDRQSEKENKASDVNNFTVNVENGPIKEKSDKKLKTKLDKQRNVSDITTVPTVPSEEQNVSQEKKKKFKKVKKHKKPEDSSEKKETENTTEQTESKIKKNKKKKRQAKPAAEVGADGEPATKSRKKELKPDLIAEDLENLSIGDNAHTLTNLLDEMTVVDKDKRRKNKQKFNKKPRSAENKETAESENIEDGKEKIKWKKRKWNKDKKGDVNEDGLATSVIVENLPLSLMLSYKKVLANHFGQCGLIKKVGVAEVYPTEVSKPVFTTTIIFYSDGAASKALEEDNVSIEGSRIRVKRPLPPTQTTVVVRSYAEMTEQAVSTAFQGAGKIRSIRHLIKGKKSMTTAFVEFDGPESVGRAIKIADGTKIGGKKIHISKFQIRNSKRVVPKNSGGSEADDSDDSEG